MSKHLWTQPKIIQWSQILIDNLNQYIDLSFCQSYANPIEQAHALFFAPFVVVSHDTQSDPIFNYGNQIALDLWEMDWNTFTQTPSRAPVEPLNQAEREQMLQQVTLHGYIKNYQGVRISRTGKKFWIKQVLVCNLIDQQGQFCGQAATFDHWEWL
jgi:hypothetical protein